MHSAMAQIFRIGAVNLGLSALTMIQTLTVPDYRGNFHFNTLGNFLINPRAGLLFIDFATGDLLMMTGSVQILNEDEDLEYFEGAERLWRFQLKAGVRLPAASPYVWSFHEYSPNTLLTGTWDEAASIKDAEDARNEWREYRVALVEEESTTIKSFYLEPLTGVKFPFEAGQFLTVKIPVNGLNIVRTYTVSSSPSDKRYRISVKREDNPPGIASTQLHEAFKVGDIIEAKAPAGTFTFNPKASRPALLLAAGVGITPMLSMAREAQAEAVRNRRARQVVLLHSARNSRERAFFGELSRLAEASESQVVQYISLLSRPESGDEAHIVGRINRAALAEITQAEDFDVFLCGPGDFMQDTYDNLRDVGVPDERIFAEEFGPSVIVRDCAQAVKAEEADEALVTFAASGFEQVWQPQEGSLLELAEAHGLTPEFGCRNGVCGSCRTTVKSGSVVHRTEPRVALEDGEALICCAVPAKNDGGKNVIMLDL